MTCGRSDQATAVGTEEPVSVAAAMIAPEASIQPHRSTSNAMKPLKGTP